MVKLLFELLIYAIYILYHLNSNFYICFVSKIITCRRTQTVHFTNSNESPVSPFIHTTIDSILPGRGKQHHRLFPLFARYAHSILIGTRTWRCSELCLRSVSKYNILLTSCSCFQITRYVTYELSEQLNKFSCLNVPTFFSVTSS